MRPQTRDPHVSDLPASLGGGPHNRAHLIQPEDRIGTWSLVLLVLLGCQLFLFLGGLSRSLHGSTDFRAFYSAGRMVLDSHGSRLYSYSAQEQVQRSVISPDDQTLPFLYPPFAALLFVPFAWMPYKLAFASFTLVSAIALMLVSAYLMKAKAAWIFLPAWGVPLCAICLVPVLIAVLQGQISLLLLLIYTASHIAFSRGRTTCTGLLLSVALVKWQFALPVLFLFAAWRKWKVIGVAAAGATGLFCVSLAVAGVAGVREYAQSVLQIAARTASDPYGAKARYGMFGGDMPNLHGMFFVLTSGRPFGLALTAIGSLAVLFWATRRTPSMSVALIAAMLVSYHMQAYDLTLLILPIGISVFEVIRAKGQETGQRTKRQGYLLYGAIGILVSPIAPLVVSLHASWLLIASVIAMLSYFSVNEAVSSGP
jgi:hypothetical protein